MVAKLTLEEKVNMTTGVGWQEGHCLGNTPAIPRLNFTGLCLQDSPAGIRFTKGISVFPSGINTAATFDRNLILERAIKLGEEFRAKGVVSACIIFSLVKFLVLNITLARTSLLHP